ncbi:hypothetical protein Clacol_004332 [Clathrus columnatus]|uniref:Uncharacterized protein n=1 Tax=Clathrus columnatus TaxID=1419009 RepID=A0AAV5AAR1_9AGAM|nr:hypothetical protein Clacol_004332 [Clathrus columnatus]
MIPYSTFFTVSLIINIATLLSDVLAFLVVINQVWVLWKERRRLGLHTNKDFVTLLLYQGESIPIDTRGIQNEGFFISLSVILLCEFNLDLRRRNANKSILNQSELPDFNLSFQDPIQSVQSVLGRVHQSIIADMGERNDPVLGVDGPALGQEPNEETA